ATTEIYTLSLHDALPILRRPASARKCMRVLRERRKRTSVPHASFVRSSGVPSSGLLVRVPRTLPCRLWVVRDLRCDARAVARCATRSVDDVADLAVIAQANRDHIVEPDTRAVGNFDGLAQHHTAIPEDTVDSEPPGFVAGHTLRHFV